MISNLVRTKCVLLALTLVLAGCTKSPEELLESAKQREAKGDRAGAIIDLKAAIRQRPDDGPTRFMLGRLYNETFDGEAAERDLRKAKDLGVIEGGRLFVELARALLAQGKHKELLAEIQPNAAYEPEQLAAVHALRGLAHLNLRQIDQARASLAEGARTAADAPDVVMLDVTIRLGERKFDEALALIDGLLKKTPNNFAAWSHKAELLRRMGKEDEALQAYDRVLKLHPVYMRALVNRSTLLMKQGRFKDAQQDIDVLAKVYKQHPQALVQRGLLHLVQDRPREALEAAQIALKVQPDFPGALLLAGLANSGLNSLAQAELLLSRYVAQLPDEAFGRVALSSVLVRANKGAKAIEVLAPVLRADVKNAKVLSLAGDAYAQAGDFGRAVAWYEKAAALDPGSPEFPLKQAMARSSAGQHERAMTDLAHAVDLSKTVTTADEVLVLLYIRHGKLEEAKAAAEKLSKKAPDSPITANMMGAVALAQGDKEGARRLFETALKRQPGFLPAASNLAELDLEKGDVAAARRRLERVIDRDKKNVDAYIQLARLAGRIRATPAEVESWLLAARAADPEALDPLYSLARFYAQSGAHKKALEIAEQALAKAPDNPRIINLVGQIQLAAGEKNRALSTMGKLARQEPDSVDALMRMAQVQLANDAPGEAAGTLRKALAIDPKSVRVQVMLAGAEMRLGRPAEARNIALQLQKQDPKSPAGWVLEGDILALDKRLHEAAQAYERAYAIGALAPIAMKMYSALVQDGRVAEAEQRLENLFLQRQSDLALGLYLTQVLSKNGKHRKAAGIFDQILSKHPDNALALNNAASTYLIVGDKRALETAERAYKIAPANPAVMDTLAWILLKEGKHERSTQLLREAVELAPKIPSIRYHYAEALVRSGEKSKARDGLERLVADFTAFLEREQALTLLKSLGG